MYLKKECLSRENKMQVYFLHLESAYIVVLTFKKKYVELMQAEDIIILKWEK